MAIQNFFTSRDNTLDGNTYIGQLGRLWYNPDTNSIYASDGVTVGGNPVDLATGANAAFNDITVNTISSDDSTEVKFITDVTFDDEVSVNGNLVVFGNISAAAPNKIGGIAPGPGANISNTGLLTIDTTGLPLSFGNFTANNNILTIVNADEDMILATSGSAEIQLVGNIGFYRTNGLPPAEENRYFRATDDGQIQILVPNSDPLLGAVEIVGSSSGNIISPALAGVMLHITGQTNDFASLYVDGVNNFPNYIGRRYNGTATAPTQVLTGNVIVRFSGQGYSSTVGFNAPADGTISLDALEDFTESNQGAIWRFLVNPVGGNTRQEVANISVANGVTATKFVTSGTVEATGNITGGNLITGGVVSATGNISGGNVTATTFTGNVVGNVTGTATTATNLAAATSILAGTLNIDPPAITKNSSATATYTLTGLTTSHKVIITSQDAVADRAWIAAAWASATNTLTVQFQATENVNPAAIDIAYFAWV